MTERKHLYLITEHEDKDRIGGVSSMDKRMTHPLKNEEGPITIFDDDKQVYRDAGKMVGLGYHGFEDKESDEENAAEVMKTKIREVDERWAKKAGVHETVYGERNE